MYVCSILLFRHSRTKDVGGLILPGRSLKKTLKATEILINFHLLSIFGLSVLNLYEIKTFTEFWLLVWI